ncbi:MAG: hypothetical protein OXR82_17550 [Gammaproteobacteria bacterium]|nr:hypothetical protein [Gammaproteobacteria bacterium]
MMALCPRCNARHPPVVVEPGQLRPLRGTELDATETRELKQHIAEMLRHRMPYAFLGLEEFREITRWKLGRQLKRVPQLEQLTEELVRGVTEAAFNLHAAHKPSDAVAASVCVGVLTSLPGVGVPVASAVLALTFPQAYCVVDFRGWRALFGEDRRAFTTNHYLAYRTAVDCIAHMLDWSVQETDHALWELDRRQGTRDKTI